MRFMFILSALGAGALVAACGGGGDSGGDSEASAKYVGNWTTSCTKVSSTSSGTMQGSGVRRDASSVDFTFNTVIVYLSSSNCTGTSTSQTISPILNTITVVGQTSIGGLTVDKVDVTGPGVSGVDKDVALFQDGRVYFGGDASDSAGYPTTIDYSRYFTKR